MNRIYICSMLPALVAIAGAQDLSKKISVEIPASRASVALASLSKVAGVTLEPAGNLRDEVFVVSAKDVTVDDLMKKIAQAESGTWTHQNGIYILGRDSSVSSSQERAELKARAALIAKRIADAMKKVASQQTFDDTAAQQLAQQTRQTIQALQTGGGKAQMLEGMAKTPTARAIVKLLGTMDPEQLAKIAPGQRIVFSTRATPVQVPLSNDSIGIFRSFVSEQQAFSQAYAAGEPQNGNKQVFSFNGFGNPEMGKGDPRLGLGLGLAVVTRRFGDSLDLEILAADPNLETITTGSYSLDLSSKPSETTASNSEQPLKISAEAQEMAKALGGGSGRGNGAIKAMAISTSDSNGGVIVRTTKGGGGAMTKLSPELRAKVLDPVKYDPMSFVPGEAMTALSQAKGKSMVALLPDYCFGSLTREFAQNVTPSELVASLKDQDGLDVKEDSDWIVVAPSMPSTGRGSFVDREALRTLLQSMNHDGVLSLDAVANFALADRKTPGFNDLDMLYPRLIDANAVDQSLMPLATGQDSLYKFYGTLSAGQRRALGSGQQFSFNNLTSQQVGFIADMLYNSPQGPEVRLPQQQGEATQSQTMSVTIGAGGKGMPIFFGGGLSAQTERTIVVPDGVRGAGYMQGSVHQQQIVQGINSQTGATDFLDVSALAFMKSAANSSNLAEFATNNYDKYRMAHETTISIRFFFNPAVSMMRSLSDDAPDENAVAGPYDSLPAALRQQVDAQSQRMQGAIEKIGSGDRGTPPPQP